MCVACVCRMSQMCGQVVCACVSHGCCMCVVCHTHVLCRVATCAACVCCVHVCHMCVVCAVCVECVLIMCVLCLCVVCVGCMCRLCMHVCYTCIACVACCVCGCVLHVRTCVACVCVCVVCVHVHVASRSRFAHRAAAHVGGKPRPGGRPRSGGSCHPGHVLLPRSRPPGIPMPSAAAGVKGEGALTACARGQRSEDSPSRGDYWFGGSGPTAP